MKQYKPWNVLLNERKQKAIKTPPVQVVDHTETGKGDLKGELPSKQDFAEFEARYKGRGTVGMVSYPMRGTSVISVFVMEGAYAIVQKVTIDVRKNTLRQQMSIYGANAAGQLGLGNTGFMAKYGGFNSAPSDTWPQFPITQGMAGAEGKEAIYKNYGASMEMDDVDARKYMSKWPKGSWQSGDKPRGGKFAGSINSNYQMGGRY